jgi:hypothetical protein
MFELHSAATWGFVLEYASTITHFLARLVKKCRSKGGENPPIVTDGRIEELVHGILPHILNPLSVIE